jgi:hypothetical protein
MKAIVVKYKGLTVVIYLSAQLVTLAALLVWVMLK